MKEHGLERVMGEAALVLFVSHSIPSPNLACIGPLCLWKRLGGVIGAHPREYVHTNSRNVSPSVLLV